MKAEEQLIAENACQARNLFQSEFEPQLELPSTQHSLVTSKIHGEYAQATKHFEQALLKEQQGANETIAAGDPADSLINQILKESQ